MKASIDEINDKINIRYHRLIFSKKIIRKPIMNKLGNWY